MKTAGLLLFLLTITSPVTVQQLSAQPTPPADPDAAKPAANIPPKISPEVAQVLTEKLPKYSPPAPEAPAAARDPDIVELPKMTIRQKKRPRLGEDVMMTTKAFNDKLVREKLGSFDRNFLNKYTLPLFGTSAAARARDEYDREKHEQLISEVSALARVIAKDDPAQAKALLDAATKP